MARARKEDERTTLTEDEAKIMILLENDAKTSIDQIVKKCGFSRQKVWRIIKKLEDEKIIWGYTAVSDASEQNLKHFMVLIKRNNVPFNQDVKKEIIFRKIDDFPSGLVKVENIYFTHGVSDWVLTFYAPDIIAAKRFVERTFERMNKYIQEYTIMETLITVRKNSMKNPHIEELVHFL
jgi:DNA-binding Lrp family transcriptional regulator